MHNTHEQHLDQIEGQLLEIKELLWDKPDRVDLEYEVVPKLEEIREDLGELKEELQDMRSQLEEVASQVDDLAD